jgi:hypothetical protein
LPANPGPGVNSKLKAAVCPAVTVTEVEPGAAGEIAKAGVTLTFSAMVCGEPGASSVIVISAARGPVATGNMDAPIVHVAPAAYAAAVQLFATLKSPEFVPPRVREAMCNGPVPEFVSVTI